MKVVIQCKKKSTKMIFIKSKTVELEPVGTRRIASSIGLAIQSEVRYSVLRISLSLFCIKSFSFILK